MNTLGTNSGAIKQQAITYRTESPSFFDRLKIKLSRGLREWGYGTALYRTRLNGRHPIQLLASPNDPTYGSATLGTGLCKGQMSAAGETVEINETFWTNVKHKSKDFKAYAYGFTWLHDLAEVSDQSIATQVAEFLMEGWLKENTSWTRETWDAELTAHRVINWAIQAPLILSKNNTVYRSTVLHVMASQARHLMRSHQDASEGTARLYTASALLIAGLLLPGGNRWRVRGEAALKTQLMSKIRADGGPLSRNPSDALTAMHLLVLTKAAYNDVNGDMPSWIQTSLDRLAPYVRAMRHGDGAFVSFTGSSAEAEADLDAILTASDATGRAIESAHQSGIQRVAMGDSLLIIDAGVPCERRLSARAGASTTAFEFSDGPDRIVVNMGPASPTGPMPTLNRLSRTTAAHSTLTVGDRNSTRIGEEGLLDEGVTRVPMTRISDAEGTSISLSHDGYEKRFGITHERTIHLSAKGKVLKGTDRIIAVNPRKAKKAETILRFHLHPNLRTSRLEDGRIRLDAAAGSWLFSATGGTVALDDSLHLPTPNTPVSSLQITITPDKAADGKVSSLRWRFTKAS